MIWMIIRKERVHYGNENWYFRGRQYCMHIGVNNETDVMQLLPEV